MREIKFRAKDTKTGEWVFGCLTRYSDVMHYITVDLIENNVRQVRGNTIGQFTGLHDKNGKEIYEGDILDADFSAVVGWNNKTGAFAVTSIDGKEQSDHLYGAEYSVVIGNIHENRELVTT